MFLLCAFGDRNYRLSCIEPLLYPTGCSFHRPFSYRASNVQPSLLETLTDKAKFKSLRSSEGWNQGFIAMRFRGDEKTKENPARNTCVLLRAVSLTWVEVQETVQVHFRLGPYVGKKDSGEFATVDLSAILGAPAEEDDLFLSVPTSGRSVFETLKRSEAGPPYSWDQFTDSGAVPAAAQDEYHGTTLLRLEAIRRQGEREALLPSLVTLDKGENEVYGYALRQGTVYSVDMSYRRLSKKGKDVVFPEHDFAFSSSRKEFRVSADRVLTTGNYRSDSLWFEPRVAHPCFVFLEWSGVSKKDRASLADPTKDKVLGLRLPVHAHARPWTWRQYASLGLCICALAGAVFFSMKAYAIAGEALPKGAGPEAADAKKTATDIAMGVAGALFGVAVTTVLGFFKGDKGDEGA